MRSTPTSPAEVAEAHAAPGIAPRLTVLGAVFGKIGLLSFGAGATTLLLMEQELVRRRHWLTAQQFAFSLALSRSYPGVHLLAQAVVVGYLLRRVPGALVALLGLLVPASALTVALTIGFLSVRANPLGSAAIDGLLPATAGMTIAIGCQLMRAEMEAERGVARGICLALALGAFVLLALVGLSSALVVLGSGAAGVLLYRVLAPGVVPGEHWPERRPDAE